MSIPLPGVGVVYSALKDVWSWGSTRLRGRRFAPEVFRGLTVDKWYRLYRAIEKFGDQDWLHQLDVAAQQRNKAMEAQAKLIKGRPEARECDQTVDELEQQYKVASNAVEYFTALICIS